MHNNCFFLSLNYLFKVPIKKMNINLKSKLLSEQIEITNSDVNIKTKIFFQGIKTETMDNVFNEFGSNIFNRNGL